MYPETTTTTSAEFGNPRGGPIPSSSSSGSATPTSASGSASSRRCCGWFHRLWSRLTQRLPTLSLPRPPTHLLPRLPSLQSLDPRPKIYSLIPRWPRCLGLPRWFWLPRFGLPTASSAAASARARLVPGPTGVSRFKSGLAVSCAVLFVALMTVFVWPLVTTHKFVPPPVGVRIKSSPEDVVAVGQLLNSVREEMVHMSGQLEAMKKIVESPCSQIPSVVSYAPFFIAVVAISCCLAVVITQSLVPQRETLSAPIDQMTAHLKRQKHYDFKTSLEVYGNQLNLLLGKMDDLKDSVINMKSMSDCDTLRQTILRLAIQVQNQNEVIERLQLKLKDPSAAQSAF